MESSGVYVAAAVVCIALLLAATSESQAGGYGNGDAIDGGTTQELAAGMVGGIAGEIEENDPVGEGTSHLLSYGIFGVQWDGMQYEQASDEGEGGLNWFHYYDWNSESLFDTLHIYHSSETDCGGTAFRLDENDSQWWWDSDNEVVEDPITVVAYVVGEGYVELDGLITWTDNTQCHVRYGDAQNNSGNPPWSSSSDYYSGTHCTEGKMEGYVALPNSSTGGYVVVQASWGATASGDVDNAIVTDDHIRLEYSFETVVTAN